MAKVDTALVHLDAGKDAVCQSAHIERFSAIVDEVTCLACLRLAWHSAATRFELLSCPRCGGSKYIESATAVCPDCDGKGYVQAEDAPALRHLASAMRKLLPAHLLAEVAAYLDPLTPFVKFLKEER